MLLSDNMIITWSRPQNSSKQLYDMIWAYPPPIFFNADLHESQEQSD